MFLLLAYLLILGPIPVPDECVPDWVPLREVVPQLEIESYDVVSLQRYRERVRSFYPPLSDAAVWRSQFASPSVIREELCRLRRTRETLCAKRCLDLVHPGFWDRAIEVCDDRYAAFDSLEDAIATWRHSWERRQSLQSLRDRIGFAAYYSYRIPSLPLWVANAAE